MKQSILTVMTVSAALLTGCGHNIGTAFNGKLINIGYDPEVNKVGIQYYSGVMVAGLQKEKSKTSLVFEDTASTKDGDTTTAKLNYYTENGDQITGYAVDLEKAKNKDTTSASITAVPVETTEKTSGK